MNHALNISNLSNGPCGLIIFTPNPSLYNFPYASKDVNSGLVNFVNPLFLNGFNHIF